VVHLEAYSPLPTSILLLILKIRPYFVPYWKNMNTFACKWAGNGKSEQFALLEFTDGKVNTL